MMFQVGIDIRPQYDENGYETEFMIVDVALPETYFQFYNLTWTESTNDALSRESNGLYVDSHGRTTVTVYAAPECKDDARVAGTFTVSNGCTYEEFAFALASFLLHDPKAACVPCDVC